MVSIDLFVMNTDFQGYDALNLPEKSMASNEGKKIILFGKQFDITRSELTAVVLLSLYFFLNWSYFSLFAPFFPVEAVKKGLNETQIGIIFGVLQLVLLFGSPLFGKYVIENFNKTVFKNQSFKNFINQVKCHRHQIFIFEWHYFSLWK